MVAGKNAEAARIIWNRFVKSKLGRKIRDRSLDRGADSGFSIRVLPREIISKSIVNLFELAQESLVLGEFFQTGLSRKLQHAHRIVVRPVPKVGIEMAKETPGRRFPGPPKIESDLPERLQDRGEGGNYVINLERWHERQRRVKLAKNSRVGKFLRSSA